MQKVERFALLLHTGKGLDHVCGVPAKHSVEGSGALLKIASVLCGEFFNQ